MGAGISCIPFSFRRAPGALCVLSVGSEVAKSLPSCLSSAMGPLQLPPTVRACWRTSRARLHGAVSMRSGTCSASRSWLAIRSVRVGS
eukprot:1989149-Pyramimonas_sp.AAC.1